MRNTCLTYLEHTAEKYLDKIAVYDAKLSYTFAQLRSIGHSWGADLEERITKMDCPYVRPIAVYLPKSPKCIAAFVAILYSGCSYVPLDVKMPAARLAKIMQNLSPAAVLTERSLANIFTGIPEMEGKVICIDELPLQEKAEPKGWRATVDTDPVYIIYTSGSTGTPKGVAVTHRGVMDYIEWAVSHYVVTAEDKIGSQSPFYFDNSTLDVWLMMATGATLNIMQEGLFSFPVRLVEHLREEQVTHIFWVPSMLVNVANTDSLGDISGLALKRVLFAGEVMPNKQLNYWRRKLPGVLFSNLYGPTEITVDCTYYDVCRDFRDDEPLPIGMPCRNSDVFLLDENNKLVTSQGVQGELCVRGSSLALGYWNSPEKTAAAFVQNPLQPNYPECIYRTGDLASWQNLDGKRVLMYLGRRDSQIKHMGYRIELGEIDTAASSLDTLDKVCTLYDVKKQQIVLYYEAPQEVSVRDIRMRLMELLPKYMVPTAYCWRKLLPLNANGKIDRKLLAQDLAKEAEKDG